jgi:hypothetical protein
MSGRRDARPVMSIPLALSSVITLVLLAISIPATGAHHVALAPKPTLQHIRHQSSPATSNTHDLVRTVSPTALEDSNRPATVTTSSAASSSEMPSTQVPREALSRGVVGSPGAPLSFLEVKPHTSIELVVDAPADVAVFDGACQIVQSAHFAISNNSPTTCTVAVTTQTLSQWQIFATA